MKSGIKSYGVVRLPNGSTYPYFYQWLNKFSEYDLSYLVNKK